MLPTADRPPALSIALGSLYIESGPVNISLEGALKRASFGRGDATLKRGKLTGMKEEVKRAPGAEKTKLATTLVTLVLYSTMEPSFYAVPIVLVRHAPNAFHIPVNMKRTY